MDQVDLLYESSQEATRTEEVTQAFTMRVAFHADAKTWADYLKHMDMIKPKITSKAEGVELKRLLHRGKRRSSR
jgi:hypothetical protein